jgi:hypothetical protein
MSEEKSQHDAILAFLKHAGLVVIQDIDSLEGQVIPRELLICGKKYDECKNDIASLRQFLSSSRLTSLQTTAEANQKWPLLNAVRQILRVHMFRMVPVRMSDGYTKEGKKVIKRLFRVERMKITEFTQENPNDLSSNEEEA